MTKLTVEVTPEQIDAIIIQEMKWHYEDNMKEAERLMEKLMNNNIEPYEKAGLEERLMEKLMNNNIEPYEKAGLEDCKKTIDATRYIIEFYSIKEDAEAYFDSFKKYEDVNEHG